MEILRQKCICVVLGPPVIHSSSHRSAFSISVTPHTQKQCTQPGEFAHRLNDKRFCFLGPLSNQSFVPLYFLPAPILFIGKEKDCGKERQED
uniref:Uncharacterized protein n=1 Tax=Mastacembelus armatus TaxID=205130 RepID=A0A3Q3RUQ7_9TELE